MASELHCGLGSLGLDPGHASDEERADNPKRVGALVFCNLFNFPLPRFSAKPPFGRAKPRAHPITTSDRDDGSPRNHGHPTIPAWSLGLCCRRAWAKQGSAQRRPGQRFILCKRWGWRRESGVPTGSSPTNREINGWKRAGNFCSTPRRLTAMWRFSAFP